VSPRKLSKKKRKQNQQHLTLNAAIGITGVLLLGFIYSFTQNSAYNGVPIDVNFPEQQSPRELAASVYKKKPIHKVKVEILNGCGIKGIAAKTADFLLLEHQVDVVKAANADSHDHPKTQIIGRNEKIEGIALICESFGVPLNDKTIISHVPDETLGVDVTVIIGKDIDTYSKVFDYISK